jgi:hypothetical protein
LQEFVEVILKICSLILRLPNPLRRLAERLQVSDAQLTLARSKRDALKLWG